MSSAKPVYLIHWNAAEAEQRAAWLRDAGYDVDCQPLTPALFRQLKANPPAAFVIDLARLPSQGRDVGVASDLTQAVVRKIGLAAGLVDFKVCSIDATWTGLRFTRKRQRR